MSGRDPDLRLRPVLIVAGVTLLVIAAVIGATWGVYQGLGEARTPPLTMAPDPPPALDLGADRRAWEAPMRARLARYGWVDRAAGVVHVPVERAAALLLAEGVPVRAASPPPPVMSTEEGE